MYSTPRCGCSLNEPTREKAAIRHKLTMLQRLPFLAFDRLENTDCRSPIVERANRLSRVVHIAVINRVSVHPCGRVDEWAFRKSGLAYSYTPILAYSFILLICFSIKAHGEL